MVEAPPILSTSILDFNHKKFAMKTIKIFFQTLLIGLILNSCVQFDSYELPDLLIEEPNITPNTTLSTVKKALEQAFASNEDLLYTFPIEESPVYTEAYVVSSDATGNFYKKIIVQDKAVNPTSGLAILVNDPALNERFELGRKIYIKLDGLSISYDDGSSSPDPSNTAPGVYTLGFIDRSELVAIPAAAIKEHLFRSTELATLVPQVVQATAITQNQLNTLVRLENQQFEKNQLDKSFAGEPYDEFDGFRMLRDCATATNIRLQTSTFSSFKSVIIPSGKGHIEGILTKDYSAKYLVVIVHSPAAVSFTDPARCDPNYLSCELVAMQRSKVLLYEDFENIKNNASLLAAGWSNINSNQGLTVFKPKTSNGNRILELSAYDTAENPLEVWLVSPPISLLANNHAVLSFETNTGYDNGTALRVFVSTDYAGDPSKTQWIPIDAVLSEGPSSGYQVKFTKSGAVSLSCLSGTVHIGFQYLGADGLISTTVQLDKFQVVDSQ